MLKKNSYQLECLFLLGVFLVSVIIRFYKLPQNLFFGYEQGRDAQIILDICKNYQFKLVGPKTDLEGIYHGAYYYYLLIIPYFFSNGNPLAASFVLILISSTLPIIAYFFAKKMFHSISWAIVTAILFCVSYKFIIFSRWLSNVAPAIPILALSFYFLWLFQTEKKQRFFIFAVVCAAFAAQFEIILVLFLSWSFLLLWITRVVSFPKIKTCLLSCFFLMLIFLPHIIFNFRNQNTLIQTALLSTQALNDQQKPSFNSTLFAYSQQYQRVFQRSLSLPSSQDALLITLVIICSGLFLILEQKKLRAFEIFFLVILIFMTLPLLHFPQQIDLDQLYLGVGIPMILLAVLGWKALWQKNWGKCLLVVQALILILGVSQSFHKLRTNQDTFFITVQEGMNYADQTALLKYVHQDAAGQIYRLTPLTIPYLHPEGWQYLQSYFFPNSTDDGSKLVYVVIEKQVEPYWQKKWTEDLGKSTLVEEKTFGQLRLEKRLLQ